MLKAPEQSINMQLKFLAVVKPEGSLLTVIREFPELLFIHIIYFSKADFNIIFSASIISEIGSLVYYR